MGQDFGCGNIDVFARILKGLEFEWSVREAGGVLIADVDVGTRTVPALAVVPHIDHSWSLLGMGGSRATISHYKTGSFAEVMLFLAAYGPIAMATAPPPGFDASAALADVIADRVVR